MIRGILLAATAVAAIGATPQAQAQSGDATWQFRCPAAGTTVEQSSGTTLRFRGPASTNPGECMMAGNQRRFMGYWQVGEGFYNAAGPRLTAAFANGINLANVSPLEFTYYGFNRSNDSIQLMERWTAEAGGAVTTPAGTFDTVRVDRYFNVVGSSFQYTQSVWFDRATNVPVRANIDHRNFAQAPTLVNWVAFDVTRPQTASR